MLHVSILLDRDHERGVGETDLSVAPGPEGAQSSEEGGRAFRRSTVLVETVLRTVDEKDKQ